MLRAENLTIEVFVDQDDDGVTYVEALMFTTTNRRLLARGRARLEAGETDVHGIEDGRVAAVALLDLVRALTDDGAADGEPRTPESPAA
jgi:hypothetical protein